MLKSKMIASVAMAAIGEATDIDKRIEILTDVCVSSYITSVRHTIP